jgi:hypothetical protein
MCCFELAILIFASTVLLRQDWKVQYNITAILSKLPKDDSNLKLRSNVYRNFEMQENAKIIQ